MALLPPIGVSLASLAVQTYAGPAFIRPRNIGGFVADVTIEERALDQMMITEHPVEQGAAITDHAFKRPAEVTIRGGFSNSSLAAGFDPGYIDTIYQGLLALQASIQLFTVLTGKRTYTNMLMRTLMVDTTEMYENSLMFTIECYQIIITNTQTITVPPSANMQNPQINGATQNTGTAQLTPAPNYNATATPGP